MIMSQSLFPCRCFCGRWPPFCAGPSAGGRPEDVLRYRELTMQPSAMEACLAGRPLTLTAREFELLYTFAAHPGRIYTRQALLAKLWGYDFFGDERIVDSHIKNLRRKLKADYIETVSV